MRLTFLGATHEVTGSCTLIEVGGRYGLVDCGMEQGKDIFENQEIPVAPGKIDFVLLTHAHVDHSGKLPLLFKNGYDGLVYASAATCHLCEIMLRDCAHIQESDAEWKNRKAERSGDPIVEPLYTMADAEACISHLRPVEYGQEIQVDENVRINFVDAGHLMGSGNIEVWLTEGDETRKVVFSGDIGNTNQPIICNPTYLKEADFVITESTYGDRYHEQLEVDSVNYLADIIQRTLDRGGNLVIPSFAVGRTQEILYFIREIKEKQLVSGHPDFPVYVDSPLANEATGIFLQCDRRYFDDSTRELLDRGVNPLVFPGLKVSVSSEESKMINFDASPKVIISASGMCEAGRIRHHLKHNLWRKESTILFVGYQAVGTLGRIIRDGADKVKLFGEDITINAEITYLPGKSGHADKAGLIKWVTSFDPKPKLVFVNHGEDEVVMSYAACLHDEYGFNTYAPFSGTVYNLLEEKVEIETVGIPVVPVENKGPRTEKSRAALRGLLAACDRLLHIAKRMEGAPNKEISRFTGQINSLADKWAAWLDK